MAGLYPGVKLKVDLDIEKLDLISLRKPPLNRWLKYVEPYLIILGTHEVDCWCWDLGGREHDISKWTPQHIVQNKPERPDSPRYRANMRRFVAETFYEFPRHYVVYRDKRICTSFNCLRPSHMVIAPRNDKGAKF